MGKSIFREFMEAHAERHPVKSWNEGTGTRFCNGLSHAYSPGDMPHLLRDWKPCDCRKEG